MTAEFEVLYTGLESAEALMAKTTGVEELQKFVSVSSRAEGKLITMTKPLCVDSPTQFKSHDKHRWVHR